MPQTVAGPRPPGFDALLQETDAQRANTRRLVRAGRWRDAEPDIARVLMFNEARARKSINGQEAIQGATNDLQQSLYLAKGSVVRRAVGYVEVNDSRSSTVGSGFLISPRLLLTNRHVVRDAVAAQGARVTFDLEMSHTGVLGPTTSFKLAPETFALFSAEAELDYAVIAVGELISGDARLADLGFCCISEAPDRHILGMNVNIIQHPLGLPKMIAIRNNLLTGRTDRALLYETDTEQGSSGSPVFNDDWEIVALHHWGEPYLARLDDAGSSVNIHVNEGVRISAVFADLKSRISSLQSPLQRQLDEALSLARNNAGTTTGPTLSGPRPAADDGSEGRPSPRQPTLSQPGPIAMSAGSEIRVTVPVEIIVRVGHPAPDAAAVVGVAATPGQVLTSAAEAMQVDPDYESRSGYSDSFIPGYEIALPEPNDKLAKQVAPLRSGQPNAAEGRLDYEHFSIKMNKSKKLAMFTATNIHGEQYLSVDRKTGRVREEGDKWFKDPRISETFWTGQDFYSEWSTYFDRGHLTRRNDPTWGEDNETAERANVDTFHWTNCSPQHFRFNQTVQFWQGAERYVLENGLLSADTRKPISVFQGPIFDSKIDRHAGDLQIPSSFFKIVVWPGQDGLKAVGLLVDQLPLMDEKRRSFGDPKDVPSVNVNEWRVAISKIEKRTGLSFGEAVLGADTIKTTAQPNVGEEAAIPLRSLADILR